MCVIYFIQLVAFGFTQEAIENLKDSKVQRYHGDTGVEIWEDFLTKASSFD